MKLKNLSVSNLVLAGMLVLAVSYAPELYAEVPVDGYGLPFGSDSALSIGRIIRTIVLYVGILAFMSLTYGGLLLLVSYGDDSKVKSAKKTIMYAWIGVVVAGASYLIIDVINSIKL